MESSIEITILKLEGRLIMKNNPIIKPRRTIPKLNLEGLGIISTQVQESPLKLFVGGLPHTMTEDQVKTILLRYGNLKSFHLVKGNTDVCSKGYAFCEYVDKESTDAAMTYLNGFSIEGRVLTLKYSSGLGIPIENPDEEEDEGLSEYDRIRKQIKDKEVKEQEEKVKQAKELERQRIEKELKEAYKPPSSTPSTTITPTTPAPTTTSTLPTTTPTSLPTQSKPSYPVPPPSSKPYPAQHPPPIGYRPKPPPGYHPPTYAPPPAYPNPYSYGQYRYPGSHAPAYPSAYTQPRPPPVGYNYPPQAGYPPVTG
jgi:RNA recognition motif-containing protein